MTDARALHAEAANARAGTLGPSQRTALPLGEAKRDDVKFASEFRAQTVERDGQEFVLFEGYASMFETSYEMWDMFGPYDEVVSKGAAEETLAADPMVVFRFNHAGTPMANTRNKRLEIWGDSIGLGDRAWANPQRSDVQLLKHAVDDGDVSEQSFMFMIEDGVWNDDFTQFRINRFNLDRGDVGPVTYGANPHTLIAARSGDLLAAIPNLPPLAAREAYALLATRQDITKPQPPAKETSAPQRDGGTSIRLALAALEVDKLLHNKHN